LYITIFILLLVFYGEGGFFFLTNIPASAAVAAFAGNELQTHS